MSPVVLDLPFRGRWLARNSPTRRVPSHGTDLFGTTYAIDFVGVDDRGRSAPWGWRAAVALERPEGFVGFGRPILAPASGTVVEVHDGEPDHEARRSQLRLIGYALTQARRAGAGIVGLAGNYVAIETRPGGPYVVIAHLRCATVAVQAGQQLSAGQRIGECGNSGNSTQPHVHLQVVDRTDWDTCLGMPMMFRRPAGDGVWLPAESEIIDAGIEPG